MDMYGCMHMCVCVWDEFSEFLLENRVPTSADFNTYPIRIFLFYFVSISISYFSLQLSEVYRNSLLSEYFDRIEVEAFSKGSVLVDYYVYFKNFEEQVSTSALKGLLNQQLQDVLGQPRLGRFVIDPNYTDFIGK